MLPANSNFFSDARCYKHQILTQTERSMKLQYHPGDIAISSIVLSELVFGAYNSAHLKKNLSLLEAFILPIEILPYGYEAAYEYGKLRATLKKNGTPIGQLDTQIAAHALVEKAVLVTNNLKEFSR